MNKPRFNVLDTAIIFFMIAAALIAIIFTFSKPLSLMTSPVKDAIITFTVQSNIKNTSEEINSGKYLICSDTGERIGKILSVVNRKNLNPDAPATASLSEMFYDDSYTVIIRVKARVRQTEKGLFLNSTKHIALGQKINIKTDFGHLNSVIEIINIV